MEQKYSVVCDESTAAEIEDLAREYGMSNQEGIRQLVTAGLDSIQD